MKSKIITSLTATTLIILGGASLNANANFQSHIQSYDQITPAVTTANSGAKYSLVAKRNKKNKRNNGRVVRRGGGPNKVIVKQPPRRVVVQRPPQRVIVQKPRREVVVVPQCDQLRVGEVSIRRC